MSESNEYFETSDYLRRRLDAARRRPTRSTRPEHGNKNVSLIAAKVHGRNWKRDLKN